MKSKWKKITLFGHAKGFCEECKKEKLLNHGILEGTGERFKICDACYRERFGYSRRAIDRED